MRRLPSPLTGACCMLALVLCGCGSSKATWLATMDKALPFSTCEADYFERCFNWTGPECREAAGPHVDACIAEYEDQIPATVNPISGHEWGGKLGGCVGEHLAVENTLRMKLDEDCKDFIVKNFDAATFDQIVTEYEAAKAE